MNALTDRPPSADLVDALVGQDGDLFSAQAGHAARASAPLEPRLLRGDLGAPRGQELADLGSVVHTTNGTSGYRG